MSAVVTGAEIFLPLEGLIDFDKEIERSRERIGKWTKEVERVQKKLSNKGFVKKHQKQLWRKKSKRKADYLEKQAKVKARLEEFKDNAKRSSIYQNSALHFVL